MVAFVFGPNVVLDGVPTNMKETYRRLFDMWDVSGDPALFEVVARVKEHLTDYDLDALTLEATKS